MTASAFGIEKGLLKGATLTAVGAGAGAGAVAATQAKKPPNTGATVPPAASTPVAGLAEDAAKVVKSAFGVELVSKDWASFDKKRKSATKAVGNNKHVKAQVYNKDLVGGSHAKSNRKIARRDQAREQARGAAVGGAVGATGYAGLRTAGQAAEGYVGAKQISRAFGHKVKAGQMIKAGAQGALKGRKGALAVVGAAGALAGQNVGSVRANYKTQKHPGYVSKSAFDVELG